jgi:hypothetical protein
VGSNPISRTRNLSFFFIPTKPFPLPITNVTLR